MAWEKRGSCRYYYRVAKVGGRVVREYFGKGSLAEIAADIDDLARIRRLAAAADAADERERNKKEIKKWVRQLDKVSRTAEAFATLALAAAGFHRHKRGEWRKKMTQPSLPGPMPDMVKALLPRAAKGKAGDHGPFEEAVRDLIKRARSGDKTVLPAVTWLFAQHLPPEWVPAGDVPGTVCYHLARRVTGDDLLRREAARAMCEQVEESLVGKDAPVIERLLAQRAAICWLATYVADLEALQAPDTLAAARYHAALQNAAQKRFLACLRALAVVRRLAVPVLLKKVAQLNINLGDGTQHVANTTAKAEGNQAKVTVKD
jgi:hypothetical protein